MNEWISVKDRLPTSGDIVLFTVNDLSHCVCGFYLNDNRFMAVLGGFPEFKVFSNVKYWMRLPKSPENKDECNHFLGIMFWEFSPPDFIYNSTNIKFKTDKVDKFNYCPECGIKLDKIIEEWDNK